MLLCVSAVIAHVDHGEHLQVLTSLPQRAVCLGFPYYAALAYEVASNTAAVIVFILAGCTL